MRGTLTRRVALAAGALVFPLAARAADDRGAAAQLAGLERTSGGRLGVAVLDTGDGRRFGYRADERFPMCSTFKVLASAAVLARVDAGKERLDRRVVFEKADVVAYSPKTETRVGGEGMTLAEIAEAAITLSDNTAGNLLLKAIGGPPGLTAFARSLGDPTTRLDRWETELNEAKDGDPRDTTAPSAMLGDLRKLLIEDALSPVSRALLIAWMVANTTGGARLRAGVPQDWRVGDKTGTGDNGATNVIAILWPPGGAPILACAYAVGSTASAQDRSAVLAEVGRIIAAWA